MENFFAGLTDRWPAGRPDYHWHILFDPELVREQLVEPYRALTRREGLAAIEPEWFHVTLLHSAPVADVERHEIDAIADRVGRQCASVAPFELTLGKPTVGREGIACDGCPAAVTRRLWQITARSTDSVTRGRFPTVPAVHRPHGTLAYGVAAVDGQPMTAWLSCQDIPPATLPVSSISLVAQVHDRWSITWEHILDVPLTGSR
ncbi:2'-5' RNA ligase family protein [Streptomyces avidinii]|uniref:2'-5' RNA ligase family protein n=1 Tax=Streptomyces avidinii TaxID=1895 RepID=UPI0037917DBE